MIENLPPRWDMEADLVAIGSGGGGLAAAITAHDHGISALVLERADQVGGVTALSMGEVWIPGNHLAAEAGIADSAESGFRYVQTLSMGYGNDAAILNQSLHGPVALRWFEEQIGLKMAVIHSCPDYYFRHNNDAISEGRYLEVVPFPAETLGEWQSRTRVSAQVPYAFTHEDIFKGGGTANMVQWDYGLMAERLGKDERCLGPGLAAYFVKGVLDRGIPLETGVEVVELIGDGHRVVGVRARRDGQDLLIRAHRGVVIAVSSYERNPELAKTLSNQIDPVSMVMPSVDGAHLRMAGQVGARIARVPDPTNLGIHIPGEELEDGVPLWRGSLPFLGLPHTIVVNRAGQRFADESFYRALYYAVDVIDGASQTHPNFPCWVVFDAQARAKYPFGSVPPGADLPEGLAVSADTLEELALRIGVDPTGLAETVTRFNRDCEGGEDTLFARGTYPWASVMIGDIHQKPNANLGPLREGPYYAVELKRMGGGGIAGTGLVADHHCRAVDWSGDVIDGLYVAGNSMVRFDNGAVMQSGMTNARGMTHGYLAGRHAAGNPSDLFERAISGEAPAEAQPA